MAVKIGEAYGDKVMKLRLIKLNKNNKYHLQSDYCKVKALYLHAFPANERAPFGMLMRKTGLKNVDFFIVKDEEEFIGMTYIIHSQNTYLTYVFYLAIEESMRGRGYGSKILTVVNRMYPERIVTLAIEQIDEGADNYEERVKRKAFYEKNGFSLTDVKFREASMVYSVMCYDLERFPNYVDRIDYDDMMKKYMGPIVSRLVKLEMYYLPEGKEMDRQ